MHSIRLFLLVVISVTVVAVFTLAATISYTKAGYEADELFDAELAQTARILRATLTLPQEDGFGEPALSTREISTHDWSKGVVEDDDEEQERTRLGHSYERKIMFQVAHQGKVLIRSDNAPFTDTQGLQEGFQQPVINGDTWHIFTLIDGEFWYTVGERGDIRDEVARKIAISNLGPSLVALPILVLLLAATLRKGLQPLNDLDERIQERSKDNLDPILLPDPPREILPIVESLNALLSRLRRSLDTERRFSATASHEMRTPLAVLKVNVQNAIKSTSDQERREILQDIDAGVDRASRLINQLLTLSRLEQDATGFDVQALDIMPVLREEIAALYPLALQRQQSIELTETVDSVTIETIPQVFPLIVRNLVDNAIKYSPEGGVVRVSLQQQQDTLELCVEDSGPGVPESEREKIFERFYRMPNATVAGSGLGLAIVRRIAELLNATIEADRSDTLGGLSVRVRFALNNAVTNVSA
ncbi:MAG: ATP-binding protein [Gammaproteobacteria bacterium]